MGRQTTAQGALLWSFFLSAGLGHPRYYLGFRPQGQRDSLAGKVHLDHADLHLLSLLDHLVRRSSLACRTARNMHQPLDPRCDFDEGPKSMILTTLPRAWS